MGGTVNDTITSIMKDVRSWAESTQAEFHQWHDNLCGMCVICSYILYKKLKKAGYKPYFVSTWGHAFIELDGYILDVTATQFNLARILIAPKDSSVVNRYCYTEIMTHTQDLRTIRNEFANWGIQNPYHPKVQQWIPKV